MLLLDMASYRCHNTIASKCYYLHHLELIYAILIAWMFCMVQWFPGSSTQFAVLDKWRSMDWKFLRLVSFNCYWDYYPCAQLIYQKLINVIVIVIILIPHNQWKGVAVILAFFLLSSPLLLSLFFCLLLLGIRFVVLCFVISGIIQVSHGSYQLNLFYQVMSICLC